MHLFKKGVILEQNGKLYDAVAFYRRATQLVPDIEFKMYRFEAQKQQMANNSEDKVPNSSLKNDRNDSMSDSIHNNNNNNSSNNNSNNLDDFDVNDCDLISRFLRTNSDEFGNILLCSPQTNTLKTHFSSLPFEVVLYILKWVSKLSLILILSFEK
jgi:F-box protein 9